jgi:hypothetical protein
MHGDRGDADLYDHLDRLDKAGLLLRIVHRGNQG